METTEDLSNEKPKWFSALQETNPVMFGYVPLGIAFGVLFHELDASWYWAVIMSIFVYAGAAQFIAISLIMTGGDLLDIAIVTFLINMRHIFYGISFVDKFSVSKGFKKSYMIFGLSDETYSILTNTEQPKNESFYFFTTLFCHLHWVVGTLIGVLLGEFIAIDLSFLSFSLVTLFVVLTIEQWKRVKSAFPFILALITSGVALWTYPQHMLLLAITLAVASFIIVKVLHD